MIKTKPTYQRLFICERVNDIGGEVWLNISHNLNHVGKHIFRSDIQNREKLRTTQERQCTE